MAVIEPTLIAEAVQRTGLANKRPTVAAAKEFLRWYLTTHPDYARNPRGKDLYDQAGGKRRYRLKARVLELETRAEGGQWVKVASQPLIDAALRLAGVAEGAAGETAKAVVQQRREQRGKRRTQQEERQREEQIHELALKVAAATDDIAKRVALGHEPSATLDRLASTLKERVRAQVATAGFPRRDEWLASLDNPPWLPLIAPVRYQWVERVGDSAVAVRIQHVRPGYAAVLIFSLTEPGHLAIDPTREGAMPLVPWWKPEEIQRAYGDITGDLMVMKDGRLLPRMFTIGVAGEKRRGSGTWLMNVWCRLLRGYGAQQFVARKPRTEGRPFLIALANKGVINLLSTEGDEWLASCPARRASPARDIAFVSGAPASSPFVWLHPTVVYGWEPVAARLDVSRVARQRPAAGGWLDATRKTAESGRAPEREAIRQAIVRAESETTAPFEEWRGESHGRTLVGKSYKREAFTDNGGKRRPGEYGFMAFYDWATAKGIDLSPYLKADGSPDDARIAEDHPGRVGQFITWWLRQRHAFLSRHLAQLQDDGEPLYEPDGTPTRRHLALIMWAGSPDPKVVGPKAGVSVGSPSHSPLMRQYFQLRGQYEAAEWMPSDWPEDYLLLAQPTPGGQYDFYEAYGPDAERLCALLGHKMGIRDGQPVCGFAARSFLQILRKLRKVAPNLHIAIAEPTGDDRWLEVTRLLVPVQKQPVATPGEVGRFPRDLLSRLSGTVRRIFLQQGLLNPQSRGDLQVYTNADGTSIHVAGGARVPKAKEAVLRAILAAFPNMSVTANHSPNRLPGYVALI